MHHMRVALSTTIACALLLHTEAASGKVLQKSSANLTASFLTNSTEHRLGAVRQPHSVRKLDEKAPNNGLPPFVDEFFIVYWAFVLLVFWLAAMYLLHLRDEMDPTDEEEGKESVPLTAQKSEKEPEDVYKVELSENMWALNFVAAIGQAKYGNGTLVTPAFTGLISVIMCVIQMGGLFLMIGAIDPDAKPVTTEPSAPWLKGEAGWPVNLMKLFMALFLGLGQINEVSQSKSIIHAAWSCGDQYIKPWYKYITLAGALLQYSVACTVILAGVCTVLSFQTVPDIVYSSMSVFFFTTADEMFAEAITNVFDVKSDFEIKRSESPGCEKTPFDPDPVWIFVGMKFLQVFPFMIALQILGRSWYTGIMPTARWGLQHAFN